MKALLVPSAFFGSLDPTRHPLTVTHAVTPILGHKQSQVAAALRPPNQTSMWVVLK